MRISNRTNRPRWAASGLCVLLTGAATFAQSVPTTRPARPATGPTAKRPGKVKKAYGVRWQPSLDAALKQAGKKRRPVVWFRVLGELTGFT